MQGQTSHLKFFISNLNETHDVGNVSFTVFCFDAKHCWCTVIFLCYHTVNVFVHKCHNNKSFSVHSQPYVTCMQGILTGLIYNHWFRQFTLTLKFNKVKTDSLSLTIFLDVLSGALSEFGLIIWLLGRLQLPWHWFCACLNPGIKQLPMSFLYNQRGLRVMKCQYCVTLGHRVS